MRTRYRASGRAATRACAVPADVAGAGRPDCAAAATAAGCHALATTQVATPDTVTSLVATPHTDVTGEGTGDAMSDLHQ